MNIFARAALLTLAIAFVWAGFFAHARHERKSTLQTFKERHFASLSLIDSILALAQEKFGALGQRVAEDAILEFIKKKGEKGLAGDDKAGAARPNLKLPVGYGNVLTFRNGKLFTVDGEFEKYFRKDDGALVALDEKLDQELRAFIEAPLPKDVGQPYKSQLIDTDGGVYLISAGRFKIARNAFHVAFYANVGEIFAAFNQRSKEIAAASLAGFFTFCLIAFGIVHILAMRREAESVIRTRRMTVEMSEEIERRKEVERALKIETEKILSMFEVMQDGVCVIGPEFDIQYANRSLRSDFGPYDGRKCHDYFQGFDSPCAFCKAHEVYEMKTVQREWRSERAGKVFDIIGAPLKNRDGSISEIEILRDITDRKRSEEEREEMHRQLLQSQKMEVVGQLAGGVAHDFNNMLAVIMGNANLGLLDIKPGESGHAELREILEASRRARELSMKMLTFARKEKLNVEPIDLNGMIKEMESMLKRSFVKNVEIELKLEEGLPAVEADANQIHQALLNICTNARDAMPDGGRLTIETGRAAVDEAFCRKRPEMQPGEYCTIAIVDTGIGMEPETSEKIFEPFFTTKEVGKGTGLGMSVTYGIIKNHGGHITVQSGPLAGTTIRLYLPPSKNGVVERAEACGPASQLVGGDETVMIVDDEPQVLKLAEDILSKAGYKTVIAGGGEDAIAIFRNRSAEIDLVLLDVIMPGMDGKAVMQAIKEIDSNVKVVLCSGYSEGGMIGDFFLEGPCHFVQKPFDVATLCRVLRQTLDKNSPSVSA